MQRPSPRGGRVSQWDPGLCLGHRASGPTASSAARPCPLHASSLESVTFPPTRSARWSGVRLVLRASLEARRHGCRHRLQSGCWPVALLSRPVGRSRVWAWPRRPQLCGYMCTVGGRRPPGFSVGVRDGSVGRAVRRQRRGRAMASNPDVRPLHHLMRTRDGPHLASVCEEGLAWPSGRNGSPLGPGWRGEALASSAVSRGPESWGLHPRWRLRASSLGAPCSSPKPH